MKIKLCVAVLAILITSGWVSAASRKEGSIQTYIEKHYGPDYPTVRRLTLSEGTLGPADCRFIRQNLTGLEELKVVEDAHFADDVIPRGAFENMKTLRTFIAPAVKTLDSKVFAGCERLERVELPSLRKMGLRAFYHCINLKELYIGEAVEAVHPEGKEGLWFSRVSGLTVHVPDRETYELIIADDNSRGLDWSAFTFVADSGESLPVKDMAPAYVDSDYDGLRARLLSSFDRTDKDYSGGYYTGDYRWSLNLYTFNMNLNAWLNGTTTVPALTTLEAISWAAGAGFDAVDVTCYYIPGYSNTTMPTRSEEEIFGYARRIRTLCDSLGIAVSGTGVQNSFADPSSQRRATDVERIKFWIKVAHEMGAPVIRIFAGTPPADIRREGWEKIVDERIVPCIREVADYAAEYYPDVRIGLQNHGDMLATANQVISVLGRVGRKNVGIVNDTGFYRDFLSNDTYGYDCYSDIARVLPYTNNLQVKKKPGGANTEGRMDLERLMGDIRRSPYRGYIPVELLWVKNDEGHPGTLSTPPFEETSAFLQSLKSAAESTRTQHSSTSVPNNNESVVSVLEGSTPSQLHELMQLPADAVVSTPMPGPTSSTGSPCHGSRVDAMR